jgi:hypothetical protein
MNMQSPQTGNNPSLVNQAPTQTQPNDSADSLNQEQGNFDQERIRLIDQEQE